MKRSPATDALEMEEDLIEPEVDPDLVEDADVETEEVETWDETEAVEVED